MSENEVNVRRPLFDRLVDDWPKIEGEPRPLRTLDRAGLKESVRRELELLFNTRSPLPVHHLPIADRSVIDYGLPDLSTYAPRNPDDHTRLGEMLRRAVTAYEPRLTDVRVRVREVPGHHLGLSASLEASLRVEGVPEPVSFEVVVDLREGKVHVDGGA